MKDSNLYPPQTGAYAVKVKNGAGWKSYDTARLQISVGQAYHEGEKLSATFNWVSNRFGKAIVCVNDTLQRFNYMLDGLSEEDAFLKAESEGRGWIERNANKWQHLPNIEIIRWEEWRKHPDFKEMHEDILNKYQNDTLFKQEVDQEMMSFWNRKNKGDIAPNIDFETFKQHSIAYLLEEISVFPIMSQTDRAVDIYPGSTLLPCKLNDVGGLGQRGFTRIDFRQRQPEVA